MMQEEEQDYTIINNKTTYTIYPQEVLGQGSYGTVYQGEMKKGIQEKKVAIKIIKEGKDEKSKLHNQLEVLRYSWFKDFKSNFVLKIYDSFKYKKNYYIVSEYCDKGNLLQYFFDKIQSYEDLQYRYLISMQILQGVIDFHTIGITHRDIKHQNIFLKENKFGYSDIVIGDLGQSDNNIIMKDNQGSAIIKHPLVSADQAYTNCVDVWSVVITLLFVCFGYQKKHDNEYAPEIFINNIYIQLKDAEDRDKTQYIGTRNFDWENPNQGQGIWNLTKNGQELYQESFDHIQQAFVDQQYFQQMQGLHSTLFTNLFWTLEMIYQPGDTIRQMQLLQGTIMKLYTGNLQEEVGIFNGDKLIPTILHTPISSSHINPYFPLLFSISMGVDPEIVSFSLISDNLVQDYSRFRVYQPQEFSYQGEIKHGIQIQLIVDDVNNQEYLIPQEIQFFLDGIEDNQIRQGKFIFIPYHIDDLKDNNLQKWVENQIFDQKSLLYRIYACFFILNILNNRQELDYVEFKLKDIYWIKQDLHLWKAECKYWNYNQTDEDDIEQDDYTSYHFKHGGKKYSKYSQIFRVILQIIYILTGVLINQKLGNFLIQIYQYIPDETQKIKECEQHIKDYFSDYVYCWFDGNVDLKSHIQQTVEISIQMAINIMYIEKQNLNYGDIMIQYNQFLNVCFLKILNSSGNYGDIHDMLQSLNILDIDVEQELGKKIQSDEIQAYYENGSQQEDKSQNKERDKKLTDSLLELQKEIDELLAKKEQLIYELEKLSQIGQNGQDQKLQEQILILQQQNTQLKQQVSSNPNQDINSMKQQLIQLQQLNQSYFSTINQILDQQ